MPPRAFMDLTREDPERDYNSQASSPGVPHCGSTQDDLSQLTQAVFPRAPQSEYARYPQGHSLQIRQPGFLYHIEAIHAASDQSIQTGISRTPRQTIKHLPIASPNSIPPGITAHDDVNRMDGIPANSLLWPYCRLWPTKHLIKKDELSITNLPARYNLLTDEQLGHLCTWRRHGQGQMISRGRFGEFWPLQFSMNGGKLRSTNERYTPSPPAWGPPYTDNDLGDDLERVLTGSAEHPDKPKGWVGPGPLECYSYQYMGLAMPQLSQASGSVKYAERLKIENERLQREIERLQDHCASGKMANKELTREIQHLQTQLNVHACYLTQETGWAERVALHLQAGLELITHATAPKSSAPKTADASEEDMPEESSAVDVPMGGTEIFPCIVEPF